ncbi:hypothetical protein Z043_117706, partial [Scleropages formosus]
YEPLLIDLSLPSLLHQPIHLAQSTFLVEAFGSSFILDLELNHHLLSSDYVERHFGEDGKLTQTAGGEHCYYHGRLRDVPNSWAALSTCHGLYGMFSDGIFSYGIEPILSGNERVSCGAYQALPSQHLVSPLPGCTLNSSDSQESVTTEEPKHPEGLRRSRRQVRRPQYTVLTETKYIELLVVNDHDLFLQLRSSASQTRNFAKAVVNMADAIYKEQLNTRIVLVAMETWSSGNMVSVGTDPLMTLRDFMKYRKENIKEPSDAAHLFSGRTFHSSRSGTAYMGGICSPTRGGGVNEQGNVGTMAITLCQSLGQNLGMMWNTDRSAAGDCRCPDPWLGCIMEDTGFYIPRKFARCSVEEYMRFLERGGGNCLFNKPVKLLDPPECGNGFVESGEECDCGSQVVSSPRRRRTAPRWSRGSTTSRELRARCSAGPPALRGVGSRRPFQPPWPVSMQECARNGGTCCKKCTLSHDAMCSNGLCCRGCRYELRGVVCREAVNDCDVPETCTGDSSQCPHNVHKLDGYPCDNSQGRCYDGRCRTRDAQCQGLWGHVSADRFCYEKLNAEGTEKGNCGRDAGGQGWVHECRCRRFSCFRCIRCIRCIILTAH